MPIDKNAQRIAAIDWLRGIVMMLMALDHASWFFNEQRLFTDSVLLYEPGIQLATDQFLTRWITHICAPTFIFLAGASIAISNLQRRQLGIMDDADIDRELLLRGAFIALLDLVVFSLVGGKPILQVLYAIGISMMLMVYLQRLSTGAVLWLAILIIAGGEFLLMLLWQPGGDTPIWLALTFAPDFNDNYTVLYPALPWLGMMMLGWVFGQWLMTKPPGSEAPRRLLLTCGWLALTLFVIVRGLDGYGNLFMYLEGNTLTYWLHVSKYPPSLAYTLLELGLMAIILSLLMRLESWKKTIHRNGPVLVFGQTALFFYLAHFVVLTALKPLFERGGLEQTYAITLLALIILYPICRAYRTLKWRHPQSLLRFL
ncbi:DUF1624 domain-containing protein [Nitrosomonas sp.]|uniref:DUF1624 domain-containing protein n=1 Tax=Nitrosomonas sp. TaxID=42353 RepID=UPI001D43D31A|nr:heparan-alpha-glucosaminide N-acetyltransferase domain-containing protein [Nitrosomonas sp.]MBX3616929.1 DUF1624 domain-containing protein [Nitrosomonas sp.]